MDRRRRMGGEPAFLVGSLTAHPEFVLDIARQRWRDWGYPSVEACPAEVADGGWGGAAIAIMAKPLGR